jgi:hypothetical protein
MTTPQKAAMHLEDWLKVGSQQDTGLTQQNCKALHKWAEKLCEALTTLRENQVCAAVTVEEFDREFYALTSSGIRRRIFEKYPNGLVIAPEKKET